MSEKSDKIWDCLDIAGKLITSKIYDAYNLGTQKEVDRLLRHKDKINILKSRYVKAGR